MLCFVESALLNGTVPILVVGSLLVSACDFCNACAGCLSPAVHYLCEFSIYADHLKRELLVLAAANLFANVMVTPSRWWRISELASCFQVLPVGWANM